YGANPLANAVSNMVSTATSEQAAIASMTEAERTRRRIGHQQADGAPDAADLVILAVWRLAL
ncbi:hypothetical protein C7D73_04890, partial [Klebsiella pneumoniae]